MTQNSDFLRVHREGRVGWIEYNRPPRNAFNWEMLGAIRPAVEKHLDDPQVRVLVFASAVEGYFSVGADVTLLADFDSAAAAHWIDLCHEIVPVLRNSSKPLLAAIHGTAVGGGLEIVLHCDVRFASRDARLGQPEVNIGFLPPVGATQAYVRLMGRPRALRFLYDGVLISASDALQLGIVDEVVHDPRQAAAEYATKLSLKSAAALAAIRRSVTHGADLPFEEGLAIERREAVRLASTFDYREGTRAFVEKRQPHFT